MYKKKRTIAAFFLSVFMVELLAPISSFALTSGPSQPEMSKFTPAGISEMVNLASGDFSYNIPLLDVGGYPVNLSYQSGTGPEDEASWVGSGWTLNPGAINRTMRGLPDDFSGYGNTPDKIEKEYRRKKFVKIGGSAILKGSLFGWELGKANLRLSVYKDNYYGIGASTSAGVSISLAKNSSTELTAGLSLNSGTREGVSLSPSLSLTMSEQTKKDDDYVSSTLSGGFTYNTRGGLKDMSLSASFSTTLKGLDDASFTASSDRSAIRYFGQSHVPLIGHNSRNIGATFNLDGGPMAFSLYLGAGGSGYYFEEEVTDPVVAVPAYGYLNYLYGRMNPDALLDFNREKDGVYLETAPAIATPVPTHDLFSVSGQAGSFQSRPYFDGNYIVYDRTTRSTSSNGSLGITIGASPLGVKGGGRVEYTSGESVTRPWTNNNAFTAASAYDGGPITNMKPVYFKRVGEKTVYNKVFSEKMGGNNARKASLSVTGIPGNKQVNATSTFKGKIGTPVFNVTSPVKKGQRDAVNHVFSYLNAGMADEYGLDKDIISYPTPGTLANPQKLPRVDLASSKKSHHISEVTVLDDGGKRMVYGIPVYNKKQTEVSFSIPHPTGNVLEKARQTGLVKYTTDANGKPNYLNGREELYSSSTVPGYASAHLLTAVLSPDYVDVTGDGVSDDDLGTAVKFNYSKVSDNYKWRAPYQVVTGNPEDDQAKWASFNEGFLSDPKDDKASFVYGEKEIWNLHSIESRTTIAFFYTSNRKDGLGASNIHGGVNTSTTMKKLDKIVLYSKADWLKNGTAAIPVKTVHFEYDYSSFPGMPNNSGVQDGNDNLQKGKLTLKKVYFTFGENQRGRLNPFVFEYDEHFIRDAHAGTGYPANPNDVEFNDKYANQQTDRWGVYKHAFYNRLVNGVNKMSNAEFPYAIQDKKIADAFASKWQLTKIHTPTGATMEMAYESDNYAFVQNRRAMEMCFIEGVTTTEKGLIGATSFSVRLPHAVSSRDELKRKYLTDHEGKLLKHLFFKALVDLNNGGKKEYVHCYGELDEAALANIAFSAGTLVNIPVKKIEGTNPVARAGWQLLHTSLPQFAYDFYDNSEIRAGAAAVNSIIKSLTQLGELGSSPNQRAKRKNFSSVMDTEKSMVRLFSPDGIKFGGGLRVRSIKMTDNWNVMAGNDHKVSTTGIHYDYTTLSNTGDRISSGIAAYEPSTGNEENPFHEPVAFAEKVHWGNDKHHFIEKPYCESYFPSASVVYSKVTVTPFGNEDNGTDVPLKKHKGYTEHYFYTAKDFPTIVEELPLDRPKVESSLILQLFTGTSVSKSGASQGFSVELNDMHGREQAVKSYNAYGSLQQSTTYHYQVENENTATKRLKNEVDVVGPDGVIQSNTPIGMDVDLTTDIRESKSESVGTSAAAYGGAVNFILGWAPFGAFSANATLSLDQFNSISVVKVVQKFGILRKVVNMKNGSFIESENLLWDGQTGEVLLTKTNNEFNKPVYAFNYPAYWAYDRMGSAWKNLQADFITFPSSSTLVPGDELANGGGTWLIRSETGSSIIDRSGDYAGAGIGFLSVLRSGRKNLLNASAGTIVCLEDPRVNGRLVFDQSRKILDAKAVLYKEEWPVLVPPKVETSIDNVCPWPLCVDMLFEWMIQTELQRTSTSVRRALFATVADNLHVGDAPLGNQKYEGQIGCWDNFAGYHPDDLPFYFDVPKVPQNNRYHINVGDEITIGTGKMIFEQVHQDFNDLINNPMSQSQMSSHLRGYKYTASGEGYYEYCMVQGAEPCTFIFRKNISCTSNGGSSCPDASLCNYLDLVKFRIELTKEVQHCNSPIDKPINPYTTGILGNWRPYTDYVYTVPRKTVPGSNAQVGGTNIAKDGYYESFQPFWSFSNSKITHQVQAGTDIPAHDNRWVWSKKSVYFDQKGNPVEEMDALNNYSAVLFGYQETLPVAVAANARKNEIMFEGFEDYDFNLFNGRNGPVCMPGRHFDWGLVFSLWQWNNGYSIINDTYSHTGKRSLSLFDPQTRLQLTGSATHNPNSVLTWSAGAHGAFYKLTSNDQALGFAPVPGKKYLLSMWVMDSQLSSNKINSLTVTINGTAIDLSTKVVPVVEGWKLLEIPFTGRASNFELALDVLNGNVSIDDVRIAPFDSHLKTFVYDDVSLKLTSELDENNFATFYEYDEEGTLVRTKRETEKGIMTIQENRQSLRKR